MASLMDPEQAWVAETLDYELLRDTMPAISPRQQPPEEDNASQRFLFARQFFKAFSTVLAAVAIGVTAAALQAAIEALVGWRNQALQLFFDRNLLQALGIHLTISCSLAAAGAAAVQLLAPRARGGGITWVMAYLNGCDIHGLFSPLVFLVKWVGSVLMMGAGLCLGVEAPMVHLGACIASMACNADQRLWVRISQQRWLQRLIVGRSVLLPSDKASLALVTGPFNRNVDKREMVSAGAAAGIAAAFGAPIGGVLFSLEEACSFWSPRVAWRCFVASSVAVFTHSQLNPHALSGLLSVSLHPMTPWQWLQQLPALVAVSIGGGLLGAAFNKLRLVLRPRRANPNQHKLRVVEVAVVALLPVLSVAVLSAAVGRCMPVPAAWVERPVWLRHTCPHGQYNDLATIWLQPAVRSIRSLISLGSDEEPLSTACKPGMPCYYSAVSMAAMCAAYLLLFALSAALAIPGGLFMPSLLLGGLFGAVCGLGLREALPEWHIEPGLYALCSATATLGGVFRTSISLAVLMIEATGSLAPMFGVIVAVVFSNIVAVLLGTEGVYESELETELQVNYLAQQPPRKLRRLTAEQLMSCPVEGLPCVVPVSVVQRVLRSVQHNGFPVYEPGRIDVQAGTFRLDGFILRSQLQLLLDERVYCDQHGRYLDLPSSVEEYEQQLAAAMATRLRRHPSGSLTVLRDHAAFATASSSQRAVLAAVNGSSGPFAESPVCPSPVDSQAIIPHINLRPYLNRAPAAVRMHTPALRVHAMFVSLSLRHIVVVDERNYVAGIITRCDLARAAGSWLGRGGSGAQPGVTDLDSLFELPHGGASEAVGNAWVVACTADC